MRWLLETPEYVVVDKPAGISVHRGWDEDRYPMLQRVRDALGAWVYPVHRLDRATSGVLVFARSSEAAGALQAAFKARTVDKRYLALVRGRPADEGVVDHPVPRHKSKASERVEAVTAFVSLAREGHATWLAARPHTGRLHQIRRHFKHLSHPLVGDVRYGKGDINRRFREGWGLTLLALHAAGLAFEDPFSGEPRRLTAALPADLRGPLLAYGLPEAAVDVDPWGLRFPTPNRLPSAAADATFRPDD